MLFTTTAEDAQFWAFVREFDERLKAITERKGADYNAVASFCDYCPGGAYDSGVMLWKHSLRYLQFQMNPRETKNETVEGTLLDIGNYARYTYAMRRLEEYRKAQERGKEAAR